MRLPVRRTFPLFLSVLAGCALATPATAQTGGSASDERVVLGDPFTVDGVIWTPADTPSYDKVGQAAVGQAAVGQAAVGQAAVGQAAVGQAGGEQDGGRAIGGAHRTLPLPSYVEVTSLRSGRTILVRLDRRGPMDNRLLIELSPAAAAQLGAPEAGTLPVRVRRVHPPEVERALLRTGQTVPARLDTPPGLLAALNRKLAAQDAPAPAPAPAPKPAPNPAPPATAPTPPRVAVPKPAAPAATAPAATKGTWLVQLATFSTRERAQAAAARIGGSVTASGKYWQLRTGPFADRGKAEAALAKARAAGYSDARIRRTD